MFDRALVKPALVALSAALALGLSWLPGPAQVVSWYESTTYSLLLVTFLLWLQAVLPESRNIPWRQLLRKHGPALGLAAVLSGGFVLISKPGFRIFNDEILLSSVAFSMHQEQSILIANEGLRVFDEYEILDGYLGKRPLFFPFFVSLAHTLTGYRAENAFAVNALGAALCLFLFYLILSQWFEPFWSRLGMVLLASFPLLITFSTSGGFETLNLLFVFLAFWYFQRFLVDRNTRDLERLGLTLVILAQLRYESALWAICFGIVLLLHLRRPAYRALTFRSLILPLLFLPVLWQRRVMTSPHHFQIEEQARLFALDRMPENLGHAWSFFVGDGSWGSAPPLFLLGIAGALFAPYSLWRYRAEVSAALRMVLILLCLSFTAQGMILFAYYWGDLRELEASRFGVIFLPVIVVFCLFLVARVTEALRLPRSCAAVLAAVLVIWYWPYAALHSESYGPPFREHHANLEYLTEHFPERDNLIIFDAPSWYLVYGWGTVSGKYANTHTAELRDGLREHRFRNILVLQVVNYEDGRPSEDSVHLVPAFRLEPLFEAQVSDEGYTRISRARL